MEENQPIIHPSQPPLIPQPIQPIIQQPKKKKNGFVIFLIILLLILIIIIGAYFEFKEEIDDRWFDKNITESEPKPIPIEPGQNITEQLFLAYQQGAFDMQNIIITRMLNSSLRCEIIPISYTYPEGPIVSDNLISINCMKGGNI